jgi:hypothetical protein
LRKVDSPEARPPAPDDAPRKPSKKRGLGHVGDGPWSCRAIVALPIRYRFVEVLSDELRLSGGEAEGSVVCDACFA